jgi:glycosyltransferase involved in cell wall biosynthesis
MISVVIPVHNRELLIGRALESVSAQTLPVDEIIVVNDASTDNTSKVIESFRKKVVGLKLITLKEHGGAARARNAGIQAANGDLIAFLDSDDVWFPNKLIKQVKEFETHHNVVAVFCGMAIRERAGVCRHYIPRSNFTHIDLYHYNLLVTMSSAVIRKQSLIEVGGFDTTLKSCQDWDLFIRLSEHGLMRVVQEELIQFSKDSHDRISRDAPSVLGGHRVVFDRIHDRISNPLLKLKVHASHQMRLADIFSSDCFEPSRAIKHACKAILLGPSPRRWKTFQLVMKRIAKGPLE